MAVTNWKGAGTAATVDRDGKNSWAYVNNVKADDANDTHVTPGKLTYSDWLRLTNFGFSTSDIPEGSSIDGVEVGINRCDTAYDALVRDSALYLRKTSGQVGDNKASATIWPEDIPAYAYYGGAADTWNANLGESDIRNSNFGIDLSGYKGDGAGICRVYYIKIRIYYTVTGNPYPVDWLKKKVISGYNCFINAYLHAKRKGYDPLKLPDGTTW